jgi:hypothetical protein
MSYNGSIAVPYSTKVLLLYITILAGRAVSPSARPGEHDVWLPPLCVRFRKCAGRAETAKPFGLFVRLWCMVFSQPLGSLGVESRKLIC